MYLIWCDAQTFIILLYSITDKSWTYTYGNSTIEVGNNTKIVFFFKDFETFYPSECINFKVKGHRDLYSMEA